MKRYFLMNKLLNNYLGVPLPLDKLGVGSALVHASRPSGRLRRWSPRLRRSGSGLSAFGLGPPRPYAAVSRYTAPRVSRRDVSRGAALDNQRRVRAASRSGATSSPS
jgi:hypothetical protein